MKNIYFSGDSFTYGEGLELYTPNDKWRKELFILNNWNSLQHKVDKESNQFRKNNSFVGLFRNHFNHRANVYQHDGNGGSLSYDLHHRLMPEMRHLPKLNFIVIQFTTFARNSLHLNYTCECDFCKKTHYNSFNEIFDEILNYKNNKNHNTILIDEFCKIIDFYDIDSLEMFNKIQEYYKKTIINQIKIFKEDYLSKFESSGIEVFFIDSWDNDTSNLLQSDDYIHERTIPLIGEDGKLYKKWSEWLDTIHNPWIFQNYPKTANHHPTPETHKLISKSLIRHFDTLI